MRVAILLLLCSTLCGCHAFLDPEEYLRSDELDSGTDVGPMEDAGPPLPPECQDPAAFTLENRSTPACCDVSADCPRTGQFACVHSTCRSGEGERRAGLCIPLPFPRFINGSMCVSNVQCMPGLVCEGGVDDDDRFVCGTELPLPSGGRCRLP